MEPKATEQQSNEDQDSKLEELVNRTVNSAVSSHVKRALAGLSKDLEGMISRSLAAQKPTAADGQESGEPHDAKPATERKPVKDKAVEDRLARLESQLAEREAKIREAEARNRRAEAHGRIRAELEKKGITGAKARAVIADLEFTKALREDDDGNLVLAVKRSRAKGMPAEESLFGDLSEGIDDWSKTDDARELLPVKAGKPAPSFAAPQRPAAKPSATTGTPSAASTERDALARTMGQLEAQGVDLSNLASLLTDE